MELINVSPISLAESMKDPHATWWLVFTITAVCHVANLICHYDDLNIMKLE